MGWQLQPIFQKGVGHMIDIVKYPILDYHRGSSPNKQFGSFIYYSNGSFLEINPLPVKERWRLHFIVYLYMYEWNGDKSDINTTIEIVKSRFNDYIRYGGGFKNKPYYKKVLGI